MMAKLAMTLNTDYCRVTVVKVFLYTFPTPFPQNKDYSKRHPARGQGEHQISR